MRGGAACGLLGLLLALGVAVPAYGATITVNTELDSAVNEGRCSLREAVAAANGDAPSGAAPGECAAGSGTDLIAVPAGLYTLNDVLLVDSDISMVGAGAASTVLSQAAAAQVVSISNGRTVTLDSITITGGRAPASSNGSFVSGGSGSGANVTGGAGGAGSHGGGILNGTGQLTILRSRISGNRAGAGGNGGGAAGGSGANDNGSAACLEGGDAAGGSGGPGGSGGGIYSIGPLTVRDSVISGNFAGTGGAGGFGPAGEAAMAAPRSQRAASGEEAMAGTGGAGGGVAASRPFRPAWSSSEASSRRTGPAPVAPTGTARGAGRHRGRAPGARAEGVPAATAATAGPGAAGEGSSCSAARQRSARRPCGERGRGLAAAGAGRPGARRLREGDGRLGGGGGATPGGAGGPAAAGAPFFGGAPVEWLVDTDDRQRAGIGGPVARR